jgi:hypothetical protein
MPPTSGREAEEAGLPTEANQPLPMAADRALGTGAGLALATLIALCLFGGLLPLLFWYNDSRQPAAPAESSPEQRLRGLREEDRGRQTTYGLIDASNKVYRLPIDRAKRRLIDNGYRLPPEPPSPPSRPTPASKPAPR